MLCFSPTGKQVFSACHFSLLTADGDENLALVRTPCWEKQSQYLRLNRSTMLLMSFRFKIKSDARDSSPGEGNESTLSNAISSACSVSGKLEALPAKKHYTWHHSSIRPCKRSSVWNAEGMLSVESTARCLNSWNCAGHKNDYKRTRGGFWTPSCLWSDHWENVFGTMMGGVGKELLWGRTAERCELFVPDRSLVCTCTALSTQLKWLRSLVAGSKKVTC